jgi:hypothetical protein
VEPGSGTTIMAYAGICRDKNIQNNSDAVFHGKSLEEINNYMLRIDAYEGCGSVSDKHTPVPVTTLPAQCRVPTGSYFQLGFENPHSDGFFSYDQVSAIASYSYLRRSEPRFRSWIPTRRPYRTFPNLFYLIHNLTDKVYDEIVPSRGKTITMRGTTRSYYQKNGDPTDSSQYFGFSSFSYEDLDVVFEGYRLKLEAETTDWRVSRTIRFNWTGGFNEKLGLFMAWHNKLMDMNEFNHTTHVLDYENQIVDLIWIQLAEFRSDQNTTLLKIPNLYLSNNGSAGEFHFMLRSISSDSCFYFDILPFFS